MKKTQRRARPLAKSTTLHRAPSQTPAKNNFLHSFIKPSDTDSTSEHRAVLRIQHRSPCDSFSHAISAHILQHVICYTLLKRPISRPKCALTHTPMFCDAIVSKGLFLPLHQRRVRLRALSKRRIVSDHF